MQAECCNRVISRLHAGFRLELIEAVLRCLRIKLPGGTELFDRAHHTEGIDAPELARFDRDTFLRLRSVVASRDASARKHNRCEHSLVDIRRSGDDLNRLISDIHLADHKMIRVRMLLRLHYLSDDDVLQILVELLVSFNLRPGERHGVRVLLRRDVQIRNVHFNPGK